MSSQLTPPKNSDVLFENFTKFFSVKYDRSTGQSSQDSSSATSRPAYSKSLLFLFESIAKEDLPNQLQSKQSEERTAIEILNPLGEIEKREAKKEHHNQLIFQQTQQILHNRDKQHIEEDNEITECQNRNDEEQSQRYESQYKIQNSFEISKLSSIYGQQGNYQLKTKKQTHNRKKQTISCIRGSYQQTNTTLRDTPSSSSCSSTNHGNSRANRSVSTTINGIKNDQSNIYQENSCLTQETLNSTVRQAQIKATLRDLSNRQRQCPFLPALGEIDRQQQQGQSQIRRRQTISKKPIGYMIDLPLESNDSSNKIHAARNTSRNKQNEDIHRRRSNTFNHGLQYQNSTNSYDIEEPYQGNYPLQSISPSENNNIHISENNKINAGKSLKPPAAVRASGSENDPQFSNNNEIINKNVGNNKQKGDSNFKELARQRRISLKQQKKPQYCGTQQAQQLGIPLRLLAANSIQIQEYPRMMRPL